MSEEIPKLIYFNGEVVPWEAAKVHVWTETAIRATNVFEGVRAYWNEGKEEWRLIGWPQHRARLFQSARLMWIPHRYTPEMFDKGITEIVGALGYRDHVYLRPTIFVESGRYDYRPEKMTTGMYIACFPVPRSNALKATSCLVSTWTRFADSSGASPRIKAGANYQNVRLPRIEAQQRGVDDAILLNQRGTVAELTGAALFAVRHKRLITPPFSAGLLESITRDALIEIAKAKLGLEVVEREMDRTELYVCDELFSAGTLSEIAAITTVDGLSIGNGEVGPITRRIWQAYEDIILGKAEDDLGLTSILRPKA